MKNIVDVDINEVLSLSYVESVGARSWQKAIEKFGTFSKILKLTSKEIDQLPWTNLQKCQFRDRPMKLSAQLKLMDKYSIKLITQSDLEYPKLLKTIFDPPYWLFVRGHLPKVDEKCLAVVGSRLPSSYGKTSVDSLVKNICPDIAIVSGLAYGIDKEAHTVAIKHGSKTYAVLAGGLDSIYPADNIRLAEEIANNGALISEYPPLSRPKPYRFPVRNRIIAGLSFAVLVVEAKLPSGTLLTAQAALDNERDVLAVPGDINRSTAHGCNYLIENGAIPIISSESLRQYCGLPISKPKKIDAQHKAVLNFFGDEPRTIDELAKSFNLAVDQAAVMISEMEINELVTQVAPGVYTRKI